MTAAQAAERSTLAALCAAALAALLVVARNGLTPTQEPWTFGLVLWAAFSAAYVPCGVLLAAALVAVRRAAAAVLAVVGLALLVLLLAWNPRAVEAVPSMNAWGLAATAAAAAGLAAASVLPDRWRMVRRVTAALALAATAAAFAPRRAPVQPEARRDLPGTLTGQRLLVVAVDGASWELADRMIARGELPVLAGLRARGAWGPLRTLRPTVSPMIWTTVFTGLAPEKHGIDAFTKKWMKGVDDPWPELRNVRATGLREVEAALTRLALIEDMPVTSAQRRAPALWNVASAYGSPMDVVEVWATWPAEPILGHVVSDRLHYFPAEPGRPLVRADGATSPPELYDEVAKLVSRAGELPHDVVRRYIDMEPAELQKARGAPGEGWDVTREYDDFLITFETARRVTLHLMEKGRARRGVPSDTVVYFRMIDQFSHTSLRCSDLVDEHDCAPEDRRRFGRAVSEAYRAVDAALGEVVAAFGDGNVVVLSDHGWRREDQGGRVAYGHRTAPDGLFVAAGPAIAPGRLDGLSVYDMMPLFLRLKGFAVPDDAVGRVPDTLLTPEFRAAHPVERVDSYGRRQARSPAGLAGGHGDEVKERLKALGYIE